MTIGLLQFNTLGNNKKGVVSLQPSFTEFSIFPIKKPIFPRNIRLYHRKYAEFIVGGL